MSNNLFYPQCLLTVKAFTVQMINHHIKQGEKYIMKLLNLKLIIYHYFINVKTWKFYFQKY